MLPDVRDNRFVDVRATQLQAGTEAAAGVKARYAWRQGAGQEGPSRGGDAGCSPECQCPCVVVQCREARRCQSAFQGRLCQSSYLSSDRARQEV